MAHTLMKLPYAYDALEPHVDARTVEIHHSKHHQAYVTNLNTALDKHPTLHAKSLEEILRGIATVPDDIRGAVRNNGGGIHNHDLYWTIMKKGGGGAPTGELASAINAAFGSFDKFKETITGNGMTRFGSGWSWLVVSKGALKAYSTANQDSPLMDGDVPVLGVDVWEHAYYLKYQNLRKNYLDAWWNTVNWDAVVERFNKAK
jgi:Fe-Mn family superoxide dismutase